MILENSNKFVYAYNRSCKFANGKAICRMNWLDVVIEAKNTMLKKEDDVIKAIRNNDEFEVVEIRKRKNFNYAVRPFNSFDTYTCIASNSCHENGDGEEDKMGGILEKAIYNSLCNLNDPILAAYDKVNVIFNIGRCFIDLTVFPDVAVFWLKEFPIHGLEGFVLEQQNYNSLDSYTVDAFEGNYTSPGRIITSDICKLDVIKGVNGGIL